MWYILKVGLCGSRVPRVRCTLGCIQVLGIAVQVKGFGYGQKGVGLGIRV